MDRCVPLIACDLVCASWAAVGGVYRKAQETSEAVESRGDAQGFHGLPSVVSLRNSDGDHYCSGTIIAPKVVLTAAQCVFEVESPIVAMPSFSEMRSAGVGFEFREALRVVNHPRFDSIRWAVGRMYAFLLLEQEEKCEKHCVRDS